MNGAQIILRVLVSGTGASVRVLVTWVTGRGLGGAQRARCVLSRGIGALAALWFGGIFLWAMGWIWYVLPMVWFASAAVLGGDYTQPLPSPTEEEWDDEEDAGQSVEMKVGRIGKAPVVRIDDPNNPARTHLVWLDPKITRENT